MIEMSSDALVSGPRRGAVKFLSVLYPRRAFQILIAILAAPVAPVEGQIDLPPVIVNAEDIHHEFRDLGNIGVAHNVFVGDGIVGKAVPSFEAALDGETSLSFTISAPPGLKFVVTPGQPGIEEVHFLNTLRFSVDNGDLTDPVQATAEISYADLEGEAPGISGTVFSAVNLDGNFIALGTIQTEYFAEPIAFRSMTYRITFPEVSSGSMTYVRVAGDVRARMLFQYSGSRDPGRFVSLAPATGPLLRIRGEGGSVIVSWPQDTAGYALEAGISARPGSEWAPVTVSARLIGDTWTVTVPAVLPERFFRLRAN